VIKINKITKGSHALCMITFARKSLFGCGHTHGSTVQHSETTRGH